MERHPDLCVCAHYRTPWQWGDACPVALLHKAARTVPELLLQTKRQIEKAVDILRRNGVRSDSIYVRCSGCLPACEGRQRVGNE